MEKANISFENRINTASYYSTKGKLRDGRNPPQAQRTTEKEMSTVITRSITYASNFTLPVKRKLISEYFNIFTRVRNLMQNYIEKDITSEGRKQ